MNILIVESENDQYFIEALAKDVSSENKVCRIDEYKHSSLDETKLTTQINNILTDTIREDTNGNFFKIGIILDMDDSDQKKRIELINRCLKESFKQCEYPEPTKLLTDINEFIINPIDEYLNIKVACFFTNVDGKGELETILKTIASKEAIFADCLYYRLENMFGIGRK